MDTKMYYKVTSKFYDNGEMKTSIETVFLNEKPNNEFRILEGYDLYVDYFKKLKDAQAYMREEAQGESENDKIGRDSGEGRERKKKNECGKEN